PPAPGGPPRGRAARSPGPRRGSRAGAGGTLRPAPAGIGPVPPCRAGSLLRYALCRLPALTTTYSGLNRERKRPSQPALRGGKPGFVALPWPAKILLRNLTGIRLVLP